MCPCAAASRELWVLQKHPWVPTGAGDSSSSAVLGQDGECSSTHTVGSSSLVWPGPAAHSRLTPLFQITKLPQSPRSHLASQERAGGCFEIRVGAWPAAVLKATAGLLRAATRHTQSAPALGRGPWAWGVAGARDRDIWVCSPPREPCQHLLHPTCLLSISHRCLEQTPGPGEPSTGVQSCTPMRPGPFCLAHASLSSSV